MACHVSHVSTCMSLKDTWQAMCPLAWKVKVKEVDQFVEGGGGGGKRRKRMKKDMACHKNCATRGRFPPTFFNLRLGAM